MKISPIRENEKVTYKNPPYEFFEAVGGVDGMKDFMYSFYDKIYESEIAHFFPQDEEEFAKVKEKNTLFFIAICGGPKLYEGASDKDLNEYMIEFHKNFSIDEKARIEWLGTMMETLEELDIPKELKQAFWDYVDNFSKLMVNRSSELYKYV
ncbi:hemoglobin [Nitratiruptor sp. YY08-26]|uniref:globin domain-containing protein n=1 Tax=unclassified Nitratiruptor TaxID=2624044 RepID=UPI001934DAF3|nr:MULTISPECIES: globin [unclassified Nitratiruptor]BCD61509.1 hemoglobin [Nitratiruptor sp. YY08-13]BCD65443.1 hemoglobin [Nitratiruptor sp. YY08-26]